MQIYRDFFGAKLKSALDKKGIRPVRLAEKLGINASNVSRWINGHDFPEDERLADICEVLGITESYFVEMNSPPVGLTNAALLEVNENLEKENQRLKEIVGTLPESLIRKLASPKDPFAIVARAWLTGDLREIKDAEDEIRLRGLLRVKGKKGPKDPSSSETA